MQNLSSKDEIIHYIETFSAQLEQTWDIPGLEGLKEPLKVRASIGYSTFPDHGDTTRKLFKHADTSLYKQKKLRHVSNHYDIPFRHARRVMLL